jgi:hypothetical protein
LSPRRPDNLSGKYKKDVQERRRRLEKKEIEKKRATPSSSLASDKTPSGDPPSRSALGNEESTVNGGNGTYVKQGVELKYPDGFIEDPLPKKVPRRKKRRRKAASDDLVDGVARKACGPFPDSPLASVQPRGATFDPPPPPPPVDSPEDVLELLRGEIEEKFGAEASRGLPMEITGKQQGQIRNTILRKYEPDVILAMVRVLVWDWEMARMVCFPERHTVTYPVLDALLQWTKELAARVSTGFTYTGIRRGAPNSYCALFINRRSRVADENPF